MKANQRIESDALVKSLILHGKSLNKISNYLGQPPDTIEQIVSNLQFSTEDINQFVQQFQKRINKSTDRNTGVLKPKFARKQLQAFLQTFNLLQKFDLDLFPMIKQLAVLVEAFPWEKNCDQLQILHDFFSDNSTLSEMLVQNLPQDQIERLLQFNDSFKSRELQSALLGQTIDQSTSILEIIKQKIRLAEHIFQFDKPEGFENLKDTCLLALERLELALSGMTISELMFNKEGQSISSTMSSYNFYFSESDQEQLRQVQDKEQVIQELCLEIKKFQQQMINQDQENQELREMVTQLQIQLNAQSEEQTQVLRFVTNKSDSVFEYSPYSNVIQRIPIPGFYTTQESTSAMMSDGGLFVCGGTDNSRCQIIKTDYTVEILPDMIQNRYAHALIYLNNHAYVFGGIWDRKYLVSCERFNFDQNQWESIQDLPKSLVYSTATHYKQKIYIGGCIERSRVMGREIFVYNPVQNQFQLSFLKSLGGRFGVLMVNKGDSIIILQKNMAKEFSMIQKDFLSMEEVSLYNWWSNMPATMLNGKAYAVVKDMSIVDRSHLVCIEGIKSVQCVGSF